MERLDAIEYLVNHLDDATDMQRAVEALLALDVDSGELEELGVLS